MWRRDVEWEQHDVESLLPKGRQRRVVSQCSSVRARCILWWWRLRGRHRAGWIGGRERVDAGGGRGVSDAVEFGNGSDIAGFVESAAHDEELLRSEEGEGFEGSGGGEVGEWTDCYQGYCVWRVGAEEGEDIMR